MILIMTEDSLYNKVRSAFEQVTARKGSLFFAPAWPFCNLLKFGNLLGAPIVIANDTDMSISIDPKRVLRVPKTVDALQGVLNIIPLQLLAYHCSVMKGFDVDFPRLVNCTVLFVSASSINLSSLK